MVDWYVLSLTSALFSAFAAVTQKKILFKEEALSFSFVLAIFNLIFALPFFYFVDFSVLTYSGLAVLFIKSLFEAGAFLCVMLGIKNLEISKALPLLVLTPGLVAIFAFIFLDEKLTLLQTTGVILMIIGTYVLSLKDKQNIKEPIKNLMNPKGHYYILLALALFTISSILDKTLLKSFKFPINAFMGFQHLFLALIFIFIIILSTQIKEPGKTLERSWRLILLVAFFTIIYRYSHLIAIKSAPVALALSIKRISVFLAIVIGGNLFKEHSLIRRIIATAVMTLGALLIINF